MDRIKWTKERLDFIRDNAGVVSPVLSVMFFQRFGLHITESNIRNVKAEIGVKCNLGLVIQQEWTDYIVQNYSRQSLRQITKVLEIPYHVVCGIARQNNLLYAKYQKYGKKELQYILENAEYDPERVCSELGLTKKQLKSCIVYHKLNLDPDFYQERLSPNIKRRLKIYDIVSERDAAAWKYSRSRLVFEIDATPGAVAEHGENMIFSELNMKIIPFE